LDFRLQSLEMPELLIPKTLLIRMRLLENVPEDSEFIVIELDGRDLLTDLFGEDLLSDVWLAARLSSAAGFRAAIVDVPFLRLGGDCPAAFTTDQEAAVSEPLPGHSSAFSAGPGFPAAVEDELHLVKLRFSDQRPMAAADEVAAVEHHAVVEGVAEEGVDAARDDPSALAVLVTSAAKSLNVEIVGQFFQAPVAGSVHLEGPFDERGAYRINDDLSVRVQVAERGDE
jgi:hypothetical protein